MKKLLLLSLILVSFVSISYSQTGGSWKALSMADYTHRRFASISGLNGKLYVIGGMLEGKTDSIVSKIDVYDPATGTWSDPHPTGEFRARWAHTSVVHGGKIYVFGGFRNGAFQTDLQVFDPVANTWTTPTVSGITPTARHQLLSVATADKIYFMGGWGTSEVDIFDPQTNTFDTLQSVSGGYLPCAGAFYLGEKIYTLGVGSTIDTIQVLDPSTRTWTVAEPTGDIGGYTGLAELNGKIYIMNMFPSSIFNLTTRVFDPVANTVTDLNAEPFTQGNVQAVSTNGKLFFLNGVFGGSKGVYTLYEFVPSSTDVTTINDASAGVEIFPSSTSGIITIRSQAVGDHHVKVMNVLGGKVMEHTNPGESEFTIDLSNLAGGAYFVTVSTGAQSLTRMIMRK